MDDGYEQYEHKVVPKTKQLIEEFIDYIKRKSAQEESIIHFVVVLIRYI